MRLALTTPLGLTCCTPVAEAAWLLCWTVHGEPRAPGGGQAGTGVQHSPLSGWGGSASAVLLEYTPSEQTQLRSFWKWGWGGGPCSKLWGCPWAPGIPPPAGLGGLLSCLRTRSSLPDSTALTMGRNKTPKTGPSEHQENGPEADFSFRSSNSPRRISTRGPVRFLSCKLSSDHQEGSGKVPMHTQGPNRMGVPAGAGLDAPCHRIRFLQRLPGESQPVTPAEPNFVQQAFRYLLLMGASCPDTTASSVRPIRMLWRRGALDHTGLGALDLPDCVSPIKL